MDSKSPNGTDDARAKRMLPDLPYIARLGQSNAWDEDDFTKAIKATDRTQIIIACGVTKLYTAFRPCRH